MFAFILTALVIRLYYSINAYNRFSLLAIDSERIRYQYQTKIEALENAIKIAYLSMSIINSILYISLIANSLIELLELYQQITGVSKGILGLTIFAWGNSVSDLLSNIAMCRLYLKVPHQEETEHIETIATRFFVISCTSCLGGVMLNSMGGIGFSGLIAMVFIHKESSKWWFLRYTELRESDLGAKNDFSFKVSCVTILFQVFLLLIMFGGPEVITDIVKKKMKQLGILMCCLWMLATLCNVIIEVYNV